jgi:hypothetical protein
LDPHTSPTSPTATEVGSEKGREKKREGGREGVPLGLFCQLSGLLLLGVLLLEHKLVELSFSRRRVQILHIIHLGGQTHLMRKGNWRENGANGELRA